MKQNIVIMIMLIRQICLCSSSDVNQCSSKIRIRCSGTKLTLWVSFETPRCVSERKECHCFDCLRITVSRLIQLYSNHSVPMQCVWKIFDNFMDSCTNTIQYQRIAHKKYEFQLYFVTRFTYTWYSYTRRKPCFDD